MSKSGEKMRALRGSKSQAEVAKGIGIPLSTYASYELGNRVPKDTMKRRIADYYHRSVAFIFFSD